MRALHRWRLGGWRLLIGVALLLASPLAARGVQAQAVRGVVTRAGTTVPGVVVQLIDSASLVVARTITNDAGEYRLIAPRAGSYRLSTRRVGFVPGTSPVLVLGVGETRQENLAVDGFVVSLDTVRITTARGCVKLDAPNSDVATIWEQAKTALLATDATISQRTFSAALLGYRREINPAGEQSLQAISMLEIDSIAHPWSSRSASELRKSGYIVYGKDDSTSYLAPGLDVLVSSEFAADHCFRVIDVADDSRVGLSFEPVRTRRGYVDIRGTLQLDRSSSELRSLEFRYTNVETLVEKAGAGGRLDFVRMRDDSWVVSRWSIRMPTVSRSTVTRLRSMRVDERIAVIDIAGGDLFVARRGTDTLWARLLPVVEGVVTDSITGARIHGARVRLREANRAVYSDSSGRFSFGGMMPGEYTMLVNTPSLDSLGAVSALPLLVSDSLASLSVRVPNAWRVWPAVCRVPVDSVASQRRLGVVRGTVVLDSVAEATTSTASPIDVLVQWNDSTSKVVRSVRTSADELGRYRVCGVPLNVPLLVRADARTLSSVVTQVRVDSIAPFVQADLSIKPLAPTEGLLRGEIVDSIGTPLDNVVVELPQHGLRAVTDNRGIYRIPQVPAGRQLLTVRRLGYSPADTTVVVANGMVLDQKFVLARVTTLADVTTTASREWARDFDEHKKIGLGQFLTREDLAKREAQRLSEILVPFRGVRLMRSGISAAYLATNRLRGLNNEPCYAHVWLDNQPMFLAREGEPLYNLNELLALQIEAIEYFAGPSETPAKYNNLNSRCGVLVVHTRRD